MSTLSTCINTYSVPNPVFLTAARDYCLDETFEAECKENEVVIIDTAVYGRMRQDRCVRLGYF